MTLKGTRAGNTPVSTAEDAERCERPAQVPSLLLPALGPSIRQWTTYEKGLMDRNSFLDFYDSNCRPKQT